MAGKLSSLRTCAVAAVLALAPAFASPVAAQTSPVAAPAGTVVTQSAHVKVEMSTTAARPGDPVTFTVTATYDTDEEVSAGIWLDLSSPFLDESDDCTTLSGVAFGTCDVYGTPDRAVIVDWAALNPPAIPANSTVKAALTTKVAATAAPGNHTLAATGRFGAPGGPQDEAATPGTVGFTVLGDADIAVGLTAEPAPPATTSITYTQTATNNGPASVASGTVTTTLPHQTASVTGLPGNCSYDAGGKTVACSVDNLADGATTSNTFTARLNLQSLGALPATATRTSSSPTDPNSTNDTASASCTAVTSLIITC
ncbi:hypothetical protein [Streptomyces sp. NPDC094466]|uniref:hypothetical protein n=1 Tax=Streptomyces sp. NPDC094466 TaxID=3366065 RepID=UPI0037FA4B3D